MKRIGLLLLGLSLLGAAAPAWGQGTAQDYERSEKLYRRMRNKVFRTRVAPHWFDQGKRFWYRNDLKDGAREFVLVDADAGKRSLAFDHAKLAAALAKETKEKVAAEKLPFRQLGFSKEGKVVHFRAFGKSWKLTRATHELSEEAEPKEKEDARQPVAAQFWRRPGASPDGKWSVVVKNHNVYLREEPTGKETALSKEGKKDDHYAPRAYWSPDSKKVVVMRRKAGFDRKIHLIESSPWGQLQPKLHTLSYRKPGDAVPYDKPHLFDVEKRKEVPVGDELFANPWSVGGLRWEADSKRFTFLYNQRGHQVLRVVAVDAETGKASGLVNETSKTFIDYAHKHYLHWLSETNELIWMSERDGWNHLYLYDAKTGKVKTQITKGEWVVRRVTRVDAKNRRVWFLAGGIRPGQDPYYLHYAHVRFDGSDLVVVTEGEGTHEVALSPDGRFVIDTFSRVDMAPVTELRRTADGKLACRLEAADLAELKAAGWQAPERFVARGRDGKTDVYGVIYRPTTFDPKKKYPVIEDIYAGPQGSFTPKRFASYHTQQARAELGFILVRMDGMGTSHRSKAFHDVCWKNLADSGFPDRIAWIKAAAKKYPFMDLSRVGIYGGSAGGQSSTRALLAHGDFYKVAVSDCGCHDNRMDKVWWNELWMGWPVGPHYRAQSNAVNAHKLRGKLLLIVGELDRNVDPASTMQVVNALVKANKDFDLLVIPGAGHGAAETPYGRRRRLDYFVRHLRGVEPRR
jgi:dipeptidyl aminopeptidase/acylaminoacyl peptidase